MIWISTSSLLPVLSVLACAGVGWILGRSLRAAPQARPPAAHPPELQLRRPGTVDRYTLPILRQLACDSASMTPAELDAAIDGLCAPETAATARRSRLFWLGVYVAGASRRRT